eukprot:TRINITY_DN8759_c0_g1::TRINITY_DN8759_c0_g1_i1::g.23875::m.23875 TRINITY_DN8759_c0_g1::TRINITY_DN8759_c0_g1_i1::g.23875  ORF type:complete len:433 (+),score=183.01,sp/Q9LVI9/DPYD_ARATH/64.58/0.0,DHO_dh/PF01180.16/6.7e-33,Dus/PF01207.12/0.00046 TRINITY_DN8759_c0_g1_i1:51-1301(+)
MATLAFVPTTLSAKATAGSSICQTRLRSGRQVSVQSTPQGSLADGAEPSLAVTVNGLKMPNPYVIGSGPPGTNQGVIERAFEDGWGGVIAKTVSLDSSKVVNVTPRYAKLRADTNFKEIIGFQNIELISDRPFKLWLEEFKKIKEKYPDRILIASIMEEANKDAWIEITERCQDAGVDAFELNFSCPHGMPERKMGAAMGQDPQLMGDACRWVNSVSKIPVWAKLTPNITDISNPCRLALDAGCEGVSAINTINCIMGINPKTLRPEPSVEGYSTPGGYSYKAVRPIALRMVAQCAQVLKNYPERSLSGLGGVETGYNAAEFIMLGSNTVQVCTGVMLHGYGHVKKLNAELKDFMRQHKFATIEEFRGLALPYVTQHSHLVRLRKQAKSKKAEHIQNDKEWKGDDFVQQSDALVAN